MSSRPSMPSRAARILSAFKAAEILVRMGEKEGNVFEAILCFKTARSFPCESSQTPRPLVRLKPPGQRISGLVDFWTGVDTVPEQQAERGLVTDKAIRTRDTCRRVDGDMEIAAARGRVQR